MAIDDTRREQVFPILSALQVATARRFASSPAHRFGPREIVYDIGARDAPSWLILDGSADAIRRSAAGQSSVVTTYGPGARPISFRGVQPSCRSWPVTLA